MGCASGVGRGGFCPFIDRKHGAGESLYVEGEDAHHIWFVKAGTVVLSRKSGEDKGEGRVRAVRFPGSLIGLEALVHDAYVESARAATAVVLCGITREGADTWLGPKGSPARTALELTLRAQLSDLPSRAAPDGNAVTRVATWLVDEGPRGVTLTLPRRVIADLLGMRPETLSRALATLAESGAIGVTRTSLRILDADALEAAARGDVRATADLGNQHI